MIDTHCHLTSPALRQRLDAVLAAAAEDGVDTMVTVGTTLADSGEALELAERHANVFATGGVHPHDAARCTDRGELADAVGRLALHPRVVALGEIGLDRHYDDPPLDDQRRLLQWQVELAAGLDRQLPIVIHNREATNEVLSILRDSGIPGERFVFHCFTGKGDELDAILDFGAMVSFTGIVTFSSASELAACAARVPNERIMIETDAPYLTPEPHRNVRPNEPRYVPCVARFLAAQRGTDLESFVAIVDTNARRFFELNPG
jgi:TatD DNase family protein